jgi:hypothetical protein
VLAGNAGGLPASTALQMRSIALQMESLMAKLDDFYPSRFLKATDIEEDTLVTISEVGADTFQDDDGSKRKKPIAYFQEPGIKGLILNKTNFSKIAEIAGDDTEGWHGVKLILFPDKVSMRGKSVDTIRVRKAPTPKAKAEMSDDIPF